MLALYCVSWVIMTQGTIAPWRFHSERGRHWPSRCAIIRCRLEHRHWGSWTYRSTGACEQSIWRNVGAALSRCSSCCTDVRHTHRLARPSGWFAVSSGCSIIRCLFACRFAQTTIVALTLLIKAQPLYSRISAVSVPACFRYLWYYELSSLLALSAHVRSLCDRPFLCLLLQHFGVIQNLIVASDIVHI